MIWPPLLLAAIVALGLVVWAGFYMLGSPLNPAEAVVMVGLCGAIAYGAHAALRRFLMHRKGKTLAAHEARAPHVPHRTKAGSKRKKRRH